MRSGFYDDARYCPSCAEYVRYLLALDAAYCAQCGARAALLSQPDLAALRAGTGAAPLRHVGAGDELELDLARRGAS